MNDRVTTHTGALGSVSHVLRADAGLKPDDVCVAVEAVRFSRTPAERTAAVSRIVLRRQRAIVRVREEEEQYSASPGRRAPTADPRAH